MEKNKLHNINLNTFPSKNSRNWFTPTEIGQIYNFPSNLPTTNKCIGVISFGGGLYGTLQNNILTNGDVQNYWSLLGISPSNQPRVIVNVLPGATFNPSDNGTDENTLDVEIIGALYPKSTLTIILFIAPNTNAGFYDVFNKAINNTIIVNGTSYKCDVINCSWGLPEIESGSVLMTQVDNLFKIAVSNGINICVATGDSGATDGLRGLNIDFPSSSPNVVACGGTSLVCPTLNYSSINTRESAWNYGGGGVSSYFRSPSYQSNLGKSYRSSPDIAMNADPNTGILIILNGQTNLFGGTSVVAPYMSAFICGSGINYFINSKLYQLNTSCFHDIITGFDGYYNAHIGYDNCTGLGSINGVNMKTQLYATIIITSLTTSNLNVGVNLGSGTYQINATTVPSNATNKILTWSSSNNVVATVSSTGLVLLHKIGNCVIRCVTTDGSNKSLSINMTIVSGSNRRAISTKINNYIINKKPILIRHSRKLANGYKK